MHRNDLFRSMNGIADDLLERSEAPVPNKKRHILPWCAAAACICLVGIAVVSFFGRTPPAANLPTEPDAVTETSVYTAVSETPNVSRSEPEITTEPSRQSANAQFLPDQGTADNTEHIKPYIPLISAYGEPDTTEDIAVSNGCCVLSESLQKAIAQYGDQARYRVLVELFRNGVQLDSGSAEVRAETDRLSAEGYTVASETYYDGNTEQHFFTLHAVAAQLTDFPTQKDYGYNIRLYAEVLGEGEVVPDIVFNTFAQ